MVVLMKCLNCFDELEKQDSKRYPYVCPKCHTAYGAWRGKKNISKAIDNTFEYQQRKNRYTNKSFLR